MNIIFLLIPVSILIAAAFFAAFIWAVKSGQYEDTLTPSMRVLLEDGNPHSGPLADGEGDSDQNYLAVPNSSGRFNSKIARRTRSDAPDLAAVHSLPISQPSDS